MSAYTMKRMGQVALLVMVGAGMLQACTVRDFPAGAEEVLILRNGAGERTTTFALMDTLYVEVAPLLRPNTMHTLTLRSVDGKTLVSQSRVGTDEQGGIKMLALWYDIGLVTSGPDAGTIAPGKLALLSLELNINGGDTDLTLPVSLFFDGAVLNGAPRSDLPAAPKIWAVDAKGQMQNSFSQDDDQRGGSDDEVYAGGTGFAGLSSIYVWVTPVRAWKDRDLVEEIAVHGPVEVPVKPDGTLDSTALVWDIDLINPQEDAAFDLVADVNKDGRYDAPRDDAEPLGQWDTPGPDAVDSMDVAGFVVVNTPGYSRGQTAPVLSRNQDQDQDGIRDEVEEQLGTDPDTADTDKDGLTDAEELNLGTSPVSADTDADGLTDNEELQWGTDPTVSDTDGDGLNDNAELTTHKTDPLNQDSDGGGDGDGIEIGTGTNPLDGADDDASDPDDDGLSNSAEQQLGTNANLADSDGDGLTDGEEVIETLTDPLDTDSDDDGLEDGVELRETLTNPLDADSDNGGTDDGTEVLEHGSNPLETRDDAAGDPDGDGVRTGTENLLGTNPYVRDTDQDGLSDLIELGAAFVGAVDAPDFVIPVADSGEAAYANASTEGALLADSDGDGLSDSAEDLDRDGLKDDNETDPTVADTDADGLDDGEELIAGTNPVSNDTDSDGDLDGADLAPLDSGVNDADGDGASDQEEVLAGTSNSDTDSDDDGLLDGTEIHSTGTNPLVGDTDGDGLLDGVEVNELMTSPLTHDTDGDGLTDDEMLLYGTSATIADSDGDGLRDGVELTIGSSLTADTDGDGLVDGAEDLNGDGIVDGDETDPLDPDTDDGGTLDGQERAEGTDPTLGNGDDDSFTAHANINIASSGIFAYESGQWGYKDVFNANGNDTLDNWYVGSGIKALWNPWVSPELAWLGPDEIINNTQQNGTLPDGFSPLSNQMVDVYIIAIPVDADGSEMTSLNQMEGYDLTDKDLSGGAERLTVQWGCQNGLNQQLIWHASAAQPMTVGDYIVVVDTNLNGTYERGIDMVDARSNGASQNNGRDNRRERGLSSGFRVVGNDNPAGEENDGDDDDGRDDDEREDNENNNRLRRR